MSKARFGWLAAALALVIGVAVSTLLAQTNPLPEPKPMPRTDQSFTMLEGRGSRLGVSVEDVSATDLKSANGVTSGVKIEEVSHDGAAAKAGVKQGDLVVEYDGERVRSARQFSRLIQETPEGRTVKMTIVRDGQKQTLDVTPERRTARNVDIDGDRIRRDVERSLRGLDRLPNFNFDFHAPDFEDRAPMLRQRGSARGRLGVQLQSLTPQLADYFGAKDGGVLVSGVSSGTPAEKAGLKAGDIIVSINSDRVRDVDDLRSELQDTASGDVSIGIIRDRKEMTLRGAVPQR
jgi:serine protease Do